MSKPTYFRLYYSDPDEELDLSNFLDAKMVYQSSERIIFICNDFDLRGGSYVGRFWYSLRTDLENLMLPLDLVRCQIFPQHRMFEALCLLDGNRQTQGEIKQEEVALVQISQDERGYLELTGQVE
jgi:hypothetical protein